MTTEPAAPKKTPIRWGKVVLLVSLTLNLVVAGIVVGAMLGSRGRDMAARDLGFGLFNEALTHEDRKALRRAYLAARPDFREERKTMRSDLQDVLVLLRSEPFEPEAMRKAFEAGAMRAAKRHDVGQNILLEHLTRMSASERLAFADRLEKGLQRAPRWNREAGKPKGE